jgi:predicted PurR-regulated permease PerM
MLQLAFVKFSYVETDSISRLRTQHKYQKLQDIEQTTTQQVIRSVMAKVPRCSSLFVLAFFFFFLVFFIPHRYVRSVDKGRI